MKVLTSVISTAVSTLFALYTVALLCSTAGMEAVGWLLVVLGLVLVIKDRQWAQLRTGCDIPLLGLLVAGWLSAALAAPGASWSHMLGGGRWIIFFYFFSYLLRRFYRDSWSGWFRVVLVLSLVVAAYAIDQHFTGQDWVRKKVLPNEEYGGRIFYRSQGFFSLPLTYAYSLGMVFCMALAAILTGWSRGVLTQLLAIASATALLASLVLTFTRGAWVSLVVAVGLMLWPVYRRLAVMAALLLVLAAGYGYQTNQIFRGRLQSFFKVFDGSAQSESERLTIWRANFEMVKDHPILGLGFDENSRRLREYYDRLGMPKGTFEGHAHNNYLQFFSGNGLLGLIFYLWFSLYFLHLSWKLVKWIPQNQAWHRALALGGFSAQIHLHVGGLTECNFKDVEVNHMFLFVLCMLTWLVNHYRSELKPKENPT